MNTSRLSARLALACGALIALTGVVHGAASNRFVSTTGNDANPCTTPATACRTLQRGIDSSPTGSVLTVLDSGPYGNVATIAKSITISAVGVTAALTNPAAGSTAITINGAGIKVVLQGLLLSGGGT